MSSSNTGRGLYGYSLAEIQNGSWVMPTAGALLLAGDFTKSIIGIRQDISFKMFTEGVISDDTGKVILNLMQQDSVAMRMTMRLAYATVNPVTIMQPGSAITARWPFGAVLGVGTAPPAGGAINVPSTYPGGTFLAEEPMGVEGEFRTREAQAAIADEEMGREVPEAEAEERRAVQGASDTRFPGGTGSRRERQRQLAERERETGGEQHAEREQGFEGQPGQPGQPGGVEQSAERGAERGGERGAERGARGRRSE
jgi:hypothetical protein